MWKNRQDGRQVAPQRRADDRRPSATRRRARGRTSPVEPQLERQGMVLGRSGERWLLFGLIFAVPGALLIALAPGVWWMVGVAIVVLAGGPAVVGGALLASALVARWTARHRSFA
jgi:MFS family permease